MKRQLQGGNQPMLLIMLDALQKKGTNQISAVLGSDPAKIPLEAGAKNYLPAILEMFNGNVVIVCKATDRETEEYYRAWFRHANLPGLTLADLCFYSYREQILRLKKPNGRLIKVTHIVDTCLDLLLFQKVKEVPNRNLLMMHKIAVAENSSIMKGIHICPSWEQLSATLQSQL